MAITAATRTDISKSEFYSKPLAHFQLVLLHEIDSSAEADNYLTAIKDRVSEFLGKEFSVPHIASTLERLVDKGFCNAFTRQEEIRGRAKRYYEITEEGKLALTASSQALHHQLIEMNTRSDSAKFAAG